MTLRDVRPSPLAGTWYPGEAAALRSMLDGFLANAPSKPLDRSLIGILVPHAGYRYSGPVAGKAFAYLRGMQFDTVVVIGPMHHPIPGAVLTTRHSAYTTPLDEMSVDHEFLEVLSRTIPLTSIHDDPEHSIEIEIPFLQHTLNDPEQIRLVPLMLNDQSAGMAARLGAALASLLKGRRALLVASSDLSHFYPEDTALELDTALLERFTEFDPDGIIAADAAGIGYACGRGAIATVLHAARGLGANKATVVGYGTSGDRGGDKRRVVGYGAGVVT